MTGLLLVFSAALAETITATSNAFTFPALVGIKDGKFIVKAPTFFKNSGYSSKSGIVTFAWSLPGQMKAGNGSIVIYSALGRRVKSIPVTASSGIANWKTSQKEGVGGVYVAKLTYGSHKQNLKLILCK